MELPGSDRAPLEGARAIGEIVADATISATVLLRRRDDVAPFPRPEELVRSPPPRREYLTRERFAARHGAHPDDLRAVRSFARSQGLAIVSESVGARTARLAGSLAQVARAFDVSLRRWAFPGGSYRGRTGPLRVPPELEGIVVGIFGLDDRPQARPHFRRHRTARPTDVAYPPPEVAGAYGFPAGTTGAGATVALLELGGGYRTGDLTRFFGGLGIPVPSLAEVSVDGAHNSPTGNPDGPDGEVELDIEIVGAAAPGARIAIYFAPNTDQGFLDGLSAAIHDTTHRPSIVSISWGGPESRWTAQARNALNAACADAATMGITVLAASGDQGATDGSTTGDLEVDFPASSPYVTGCGGTHLALANGRITEEVVWNEEAIGEGATGGGVSRAFARPTFQNGAKIPMAPNGFSGRGVPDVAGDADPASGYSVVIDGAPAVMGGTSAVAPLWAALVARLSEIVGAPLGYLNPTLYRPAEAGTFHDILSGSNDGYDAGPGWDPCTGLGSPDGGRLLTALRGRPSAP